MNSEPQQNRPPVNIEQSALAQEKVACWKCKKPVDRQDNFCRHCGQGLGDKAPWYYQHYGILIIIPMVGPLALYNIIKSPVISVKAKIIYTIATLAFTAAVVYAVYFVFNMLFSLINGTMTGAMYM
ncbi:hypothetical protein Emin_1506 [Elusimicrobium minutum Pei191]|uniref:Putative zinc-ribbon domain-containing protein n=1 Tax=Elusimicrobium minutum (strain Pei191) TaxID=445932 RepID=B2KEV8_ELUMP|nr:zinc ribbon domain-containing protein [Elusimicrobium minutum]ACC99054.1 hypothetical protein Emin_1506 [Elusimicrobium minutum Pei191]